MELFLMYEQYPWVLGDVVCDLKAVLTETFINTSILTIVAFSGERYLAICHPLSTYAQKSAKKTRRTILLIWIISFLAAAPWAWFTKVKCTMKFNQPHIVHKVQTKAILVYLNDSNRLQRHSIF